jgi:hypothetical protein
MGIIACLGLRLPLLSLSIQLLPIRLLPFNTSVHFWNIWNRVCRTRSDSLFRAGPLPGFHHFSFPAQSRDRFLVRYRETRQETRQKQVAIAVSVGPAVVLPGFFPTHHRDRRTSCPVPYRVGSIAIRLSQEAHLEHAARRLGHRGGQFIYAEAALLGTRQTSPGTLSYLNGQPPN